MTLVTYDTLWNNHYSSDSSRANYRDADAVFDEMGLDFEKFVKEDPSYENTCAVRMSLALLKSSVPFTGRLKIKDGKFKGKRIEPGAKRLADELANPRAFGKPTWFSDPLKAEAKVKGNKGLIFFHKIVGYGGGHIDCIDWTTEQSICHSNCYFNCKETWFWKLP
jgi:Type VI secretion system (T6SS), amidase effector protein 4